MKQLCLVSLLTWTALAQQRWNPRESSSYCGNTLLSRGGCLSVTKCALTREVRGGVAGELTCALLLGETGHPLAQCSWVPGSGNCSSDSRSWEPSASTPDRLCSEDCNYQPSWWTTGCNMTYQKMYYVFSPKLYTYIVKGSGSCTWLVMENCSPNTTRILLPAPQRAGFSTLSPFLLTLTSIHIPNKSSSSSRALFPTQKRSSVNFPAWRRRCFPTRTPAVLSQTLLSQCSHGGHYVRPLTTFHCHDYENTVDGGS